MIEKIMATENKTQQGAQVPTQAMSQNSTALKKFEEATLAKIQTHIETMQEANELTLPTNYHVGNAMKSAYLYLQTIKDKNGQSVVDVCSQGSIYNCLLEMVTKGEHPKKHCYFIPTGKELSYWEKYTGKLMRAKRDAGVKDIFTQVVYEKDNFVYTVDECGQYQLVKHDTAIENIDITKIKAAYAVVEMQDGRRHLEVMTIDQIRKAWQQGAAKGNSGAHVNFTDQMAKRTVLNRACKVVLESSTETESDDDSMVPPSASEAERDQANAAYIDSDGNRMPEPRPAADTVEEPEDYEDVTTTQQAGTASKRDCPI